mgnify:CR=1 FL=1
MLIESKLITTTESVTTRSSLQEIKERVQNLRVGFFIPGSPFLADERVFPFISGTKLGAVLIENGNTVDLVDLSGYSNPKEIVEDYVTNNSTDIFCLTATTPQIPNAIAIAQEIRHLKPDAKVILGGPHATLTYGALQKDREVGRQGRGTADFVNLLSIFDVIVAGDGEKAIFKAIDLTNTDRVIEAQSRTSPFFIQRGELENFPHPARDLIDMDSYHYYIDGHRAFSLIAQLGCPFECGFCGGRDIDSGRVIRTRTMEDIISEAEEVILASFQRALESHDPKKALTAIMFYDDELNVSPKNLESLCKGLIGLQKKLAQELSPELQKELGLEIEGVHGERRLAMRFRGFVKSELFTQEQANLMYEAGFRVLLTGIESGSNKILSAMRKHTSRQINSRCIEYAHNAGLKVKALMSIGHPGESPETIAESVEWVLSNLKPGDDVDWAAITQYPGSPYYDRSIYVPRKKAWLYRTRVKNGTSGKKETLRLWSKSTDPAKDVLYYKGIPGQYVSYIWTDYLTSEQIVEQRDKAEEITRNHLKLPQITSIAEKQFEHSMGQGLPQSILRNSKTIYQS